MKIYHNQNQFLLKAKPIGKGLMLSLMLFLMVTGGHAQDQKVSINVEDVTLESVILSIRKQAEINIIYSNDEVYKYKKVSVSVQNGTVDEALKQALTNTQLRFIKENGTIVITKIKDEAKVSNPQKLQTQTIRGIVLDRESKATLPGANVIILGTNPMIGTASNIDGEFELKNVPIGRHDIKVLFLGYEDAIVSDILVGTVKEVVLTIELTESVMSLNQATVTNVKGESLNEMSSISGKSFSVEETKRYAASIGDPARMAQSFAGVSTGDDASNEIIIRGNSPNWLLWRLEGVEIPSPNHFSEEGGSAGAVSILSTNMLDVSDFYSGAFSAEFGNALSGVFDIRLRKGNNKEHEYSAQLGVLGLELAAEGPFKKDYKGSFLFNYRYSTLSILNNLNIEVSENALPNYQDLSLKVNLPTKKVGTFSIWGIGGASSTDEKYLPDTALGEEFKYGYSDYTTTGMYAAELTHTIFADSKSFIKTVISNSASQSSQTFDQMNSLGVLKEDFYDDLLSNSVRLNSYYNRKLSSRLTARGGVILSNSSYKYFSHSKDSLDNWTTILNSKGKTNQYQLYAQGKYKFTDKLVMTTGLHYMYFQLNNDNSIEPRFGLTYQLPNQQKVSAGFGIHSKPEQLSTYFIESEDENGNSYLPNKNLSLANSIHYVLSYEKRFESILAKAETYYQYIPNLPVANNPNKIWSPIFGGASPNDTLASIGKARNYGLEITVQKFFSNSYYFMLTGSLFQSEYKAADNVWRSTKYNTNYIANFVGGKEFKWGDNKLISTNLRLLWNGGKRLIPINLESSIAEGEGVYETDNLWATKGSDYFRVDIGAKLHFFNPKVEHVIALDIQNTTNKSNQWTEIYNPEKEKIEQYPMAGLIPILSYKIKF